MIASLTLEIFIPMSLSLKDKRSIVTSIREKCRNRYNVAVAEIAQQEKWKNATLGIVTIGNNHRHLEQLLIAVLNFVEEFYEISVTDYQMDFY